MINKLLLFALLAAFVSASTTPTLTKSLGFGTASAYAADDNSQGDSNAQGEDGDVDGQ